MKLVTVFNHDELIALQSAIIVEMWDRVLGTGTGKRKFNAEFNAEEREFIKKYYKIFHKWHMGTGIPQKHEMTISGYELIRRAVKFFALY